jgi:hypothetical protein
MFLQRQNRVDLGSQEFSFFSEFYERFDRREMRDSHLGQLVLRSAIQLVAYTSVVIGSFTNGNERTFAGDTIYGFVAADYLRQAKNDLCDGCVHQDPSEHLMRLQSVISAKRG